LRITKIAALLLLLPCSAVQLQAQSTDTKKTGQPESTNASPAHLDDGTQSTAPDSAPPAPTQAVAPPDQNKKKEDSSDDQDKKKDDSSEGKQTSRIMWVVPNFAAVSADTQLPPQSASEKFKMASEDSVDYSAFIWAGMVAGQSMALRSYPELGTGAAGYARYYWRAFVDQASGSYFTEAIVPAIMHEDGRYYTLGHGGFFRRTAYALSRVVITKEDSGGTGFNYSEIVGNALEAGLSNAYYPPEERGLSKTAQNWGTQIEAAALNNIVKEFWPDIRRHVLRRKD
jgi:hypothetical protein